MTDRPAHGAAGGKPATGQQLALLPEDDPDRPRPSRRRWVPRCDDCKRRIWSPSSLRRRFGLLLGGRCYRRRRAAMQRLRIPHTIPIRPPGDIPGQTEIPLPTDDPTPAGKEQR